MFYKINEHAFIPILIFKCPLNCLFLVKSCSSADDISSTSKVVAYSALEIIIQSCNNIISAKICMNDLFICREYTKSLEALCNAANSGNIKFCPKFDDVSIAMDTCIKKFEYAELCSRRMKVVVKYCSTISEGTQINACVFAIFCIVLNNFLLIYIVFFKPYSTVQV